MTVHIISGGMFSNVRKTELAAAVLGLPSALLILLVIALGKSVEKMGLEKLSPGGSIVCYRPPDVVHHLPKRSLEEVLIKSWA